tara:strand:+ start:961 stop:2913 length:1953 start_codon:yes stop_codon:yes gene_type:complete
MANVTNIEIRAQDKTTTAFRKVNSGLNKLDANLKSTSGAMGLMNGGLARMAGLMGGVIGVSAITGFAKNLLKVGDRLQKVSLQLGITVEQLEIYQFAASQSGVGTEALNKSLQKFSRNIAEAGTGAAIQVEAFQGLGISIHDTNGNLKDSPALFAEVATAIKSLQSPTEKIRIATDLFGKSGVELLPLLNTGSEGIKNFEKALREAGGIIGGDAADAMAEFNDKIDIVTTGLRGKLAPVLVAILPALTLLVENLDNIAAGATLLATTFIAAKLPAFITAIAIALKGLTIAMLTNPLTALAAAITGIAAAIYLHGDTISEWFGFAAPASKDVEKVNKDLKESTPIIEDLNNVTKKRLQLAEKVVKTTKKQLIPSLKKLEDGLGKTKIQFKNLQGRGGLGGVTLAFRRFFMNLSADALFYLGGTSQTIKTNFSNMKIDFEEFFMALDNIVIFEGRHVRSAFSAVMKNLENQVKALSIQVEEITIDVPASAFSFKSTVVRVPANIFDVRAIAGAQAKLNDLVAQINSYSQSTRTISRNANAVLYGGQTDSDWLPYWSSDLSALSVDWKPGPTRQLDSQIPTITSGARTSARTMSPSVSSQSPASRNANSSSSDNAVTVNIYDGTGQKISAYDSSLRVEISQRAYRNGQFSALE